MQEPKAHEEQTVNNNVCERLKIRRLNDELRVQGRGGRILMTLGVDGLEANRRQRVIEAVRTYQAFTTDNDPFGEHDFGEVEIDGQAVMFKIDYYDFNVGDVLTAPSGSVRD